MACFLVPATEAVVTTVVRKVMEKSQDHGETVKIRLDNGKMEVAEKLPFARKLKWLTNLLWGGSALLAFEHLWHGEVVPWFPFLTAMSDPAERDVHRGRDHGGADHPGLAGHAGRFLGHREAGA